MEWNLSLWTCHFVMVVELGCVIDLTSYASEDLVPGWCNHAKLVEGYKPDKGKPLSSRLITWPRKNYFVIMETLHIQDNL